MNRHWILWSVVLLLLLGNVAISTAQNDITFQVKMSVMMLEGKFDPGAGDIVTIAGTLNSWSNAADTLKDNDGDSVYTITKSLAAGAVDYKFFKTLRGGVDWEGDPNRTHTVSGAATLPVEWFNRDSVVTLSTNVDVTFQVRMNVLMLETRFQPGNGDIVTVAGSFNGWSTAADTLKDGDGDSVFTLTKNMPMGDISYKFFKSLRGGLDWEGDPNRTATIAGATTLPVTYFNRDSVVNPPVPVGVTFQVNMRIKLLEGSFVPGSGDIVRVAGSFNGWQNGTDTLQDDNNDSIYTKSLNIDENSSIQYKFLKTPRGGLDWENIADNRTYTVPPGGATIEPVYFGNDTLYNAPISGNLLFQTNMKAFEDLGWFRPDLNDSLQVRGGFNGWVGTLMDVIPGEPGLYEVVIPFAATIGDHMDYKFFIRFGDSTAKAAIFEGYLHSSPAGDGWFYEHPAVSGDGNRGFDLMSGGDVVIPMFNYSDINPAGVLGPNDSVLVTLRVNMGPAKAYADAFVPGVDTVRLVWQDALWRSAQQKLQGGVANFPGTMLLSPAPDGGDSIYQVAFKVKGPTHYNLQYTYRYLHPGGGAVDQGGGLGGQNPFITRFIQPVGPNLWPASYSAPIDLWQRDRPLPGETAPFTTDIAQEPTGDVPLVYSLNQNYPNPFNPSTRIKYSIPENARVSLKVYNVLGQAVATLVDEQQTRGSYVALFEAPRLATGIYFYRLEAGKFTQTMKMLLLK